MQAIDAVNADRALPRQMVETNVLQRHPLRLDPELRCEATLESNRHIAEADRPVSFVEQRLRHDADGVREVDHPRVFGAMPGRRLRDVEHDGHRAQRLGEAAGPRRLLADAAELKGQGFVQ